MQSETSTTANYVVYASLLVSLLAHIGFVISSNDALAIIAGIVATVGVIYQHMVVKKANALGVAKGTIIKNN